MKTATTTVRAYPSLALIKYWGKTDALENIPATSSLAITLEDLFTETKIFLDDADQVSINGTVISIDRFTPIFDRIRKTFATQSCFRVVSRTNFPVAAGLASSSSGMAAIAFGLAHLLEQNPSLKKISKSARIGSASAARAVYGGFTILKSGATHADPLFDKTHWNHLRVIIAVVKPQAKSTSSRVAMEISKKNSPFYLQWIEESKELFEQALGAVENKDLKTLGPLIRKSYLMMFSTMFTSTPPLIYWEPESIQLIRECEKLRSEGVQAWETMDAGPQVKVLCEEENQEMILKRLQNKCPQASYIVSKVGGGPKILE